MRIIKDNKIICISLPTLHEGLLLFAWRFFTFPLEELLLVVGRIVGAALSLGGSAIEGSC